MTAIVPFQFESTTLRTVTIDDELWWVAKDAASALGYADTTNAIKQHCRGVAKHHPILDALGRMQDTRIINEADLMRLMVNSQLPSAEKFERWVFEDVLPSIRKTGGYTTPKSIPAERPTKLFPEYLRIAKLIGLDKNAAALSANQATFKKTGENVLALMDITHLETDQRWFTPTDLGKRIDVSGRQFNLLLLERGLQEMDGAGHWCPTDSARGLFRFFDTSKRHMDGTIVQQLKWSSDVLDMINRVAA